MLSIKDVIKNSVYEALGGGTGLSAASIIQILLISCILGIYIYYVYKSTSKAAFYSKDLNVTLAGMVVIVAAILVAMQSSLIVSLGMVGALSIVRFRNAVKNPIDLLYLFWSVSTGIICGVGLYLLAAVLCIVMTVLLLLLEMLPNSKAPALLVIRLDNIDFTSVSSILEKKCRYYKEKSRCMRRDGIEVIVELKTTNKEELMGELSKIQGILEVNLLVHDGESRI